MRRTLQWAVLALPIGCCPGTLGTVQGPAGYLPSRYPCSNLLSAISLRHMTLLPTKAVMFHDSRRFNLSLFVEDDAVRERGHLCERYSVWERCTYTVTAFAERACLTATNRWRVESPGGLLGPSQGGDRSRGSSRSQYRRGDPGYCRAGRFQWPIRSRLTAFVPYKRTTRRGHSWGGCFWAKSRTRTEYCLGVRGTGRFANRDPRRPTGCTASCA